MKYLLFYFALAVPGSSGWISCSGYSNPTCTPAPIYPQQSQWTAELKNSKAECMDALKKYSDPTKAWCIPVNGYTNELVPY